MAVPRPSPRASVTPGGSPRWIFLSTPAAFLAAVLVTASLAACSSGGGGSDPAAATVLQTQPDFHPGAPTPPCLIHQTAAPTAAYHASQGQQPVPELTFLAYYTAAGNEPFCDNHPANSVDKTWAQLYVQLTGNQDAVKNLVG